MSKYKKHHPFCNYFRIPIEECKFCDRYWEEYPLLNENETEEEIINRYFPEVRIVAFMPKRENKKENL